jgi:hypothetical protein
MDRPVLLSLGFCCGACSVVGSDVLVEVQLGSKCSRSRACYKYGFEKAVHVVSRGDSGHSVLISDDYFFVGPRNPASVQSADH